MAGNTIGQLFRVTTCGESHGVGLMAIVDGVPPGLALTEEDLQIDLKSFQGYLKVKPQVHQLVYSFVILTKNRKITGILRKPLDRVTRIILIHKSMVSVIIVVVVVQVLVKLLCVLQLVLLRRNI